MFEEKIILNRLKWLSAMEPSEHAVDLAMDEVRQRLTDAGIIGPTVRTNTYRLIVKNKITKFAAAAVFLIFVALPLTYGAAKLIKYFQVEKTKQVFTYEDKKYIGGREVVVVKNSDTEETVIRVKEALELIKDGKAEKIEPGRYRVKLSDGTMIEMPYKTEADLKVQLDEIEELRKAGKFEKVYKPELDYVDADGIAHKAYEAHFILSNGEKVIVLDSEKVDGQQ